MEPRKIKTALEIALERAERLGAASQEEMWRQEEERQRASGKVLAERYLVGLPLREVEEQWSRSSGAVWARRSFLDALVDAVGSEDGAKADSAIQAILHFAPSERVKSIAAQIEDLRQSYLAAKESDLLAYREEIAGDVARWLEGRGIAGSAVRVNVDAQEAWLRAQTDLDALQSERMLPLKQRLKSAIGSLQ